MNLYKITNTNGRARYGYGSWPLPQNGQPGKWLRVKSQLRPCKHGLHLCRERDLIYWLGPEIWEAEADDNYKHMVCNDKIVVRRARLVRRIETWNECTARLFSCDCAERVLPIFETVYFNDIRPRKSISVARRYARGLASLKELENISIAARTAAQSTSNIAAGSAAWAAAWSAARVIAGATAKDAAWAASKAVARNAVDAVETASWFAAMTVERQWQTERLMEYLRGERS